MRNNAAENNTEGVPLIPMLRAIVVAVIHPEFPPFMTRPPP